MPRIKVKYLVIKNSRNYWQPKSQYNAAGFLTQRLSNDINEAMLQAIEYNRELDAWRAGEQQGGYIEGTVSWVSNHYQKDELFTNLRTNTQKEYVRLLGVVESAIGKFNVKSIERKHAKALYNKFKDKRRTAQLIVAVARIVFNHAKDLGLIAQNPFDKMRIKSNRPRDQIWTAEEMLEAASKAIELKRPSIALALYMGAYLGQRQGDILKCTWGQYDGNKIKIKQSKTGAFIEVPCTKALKVMLDSTPKTSTQIVINEETKQPYKSYDFRHFFREVMNKTEVSKELQYRDLRRTAVVRLAEAGCTTAEIAAITGHAIETTQKIMEVYLPRNSLMASNAIAKLERTNGK